MNFHEKLKDKFEKKYNNLLADLLKETENDFSKIWEEYTGEALKEKNKTIEEGFAYQERNKMLEKKQNELEEEIKLLEKTKNELNANIATLEEVFKKYKSDTDKTLKEKSDILSKVKEIEEREKNSVIVENKISAEMVLLREKELSIKRAFAQING